MSAHFITKKKKKKKRKKLFFFAMFILGIILSFMYLDHNLKKIDNKEFVEILLSEANLNNTNTMKKIINKALDNFVSPAQILFGEYKSPYQKVDKQVMKEKEEQNPLIYIYNSHQTEEYAASNFVEFSINPTVMMADYILEDVFLKNNLESIVEERKIKDILNQNNWKYNYSYKASRLLMEDVVSQHDSLKYFIDVHRDSLPRDKTTVLINDKNYAKVMFLIGLENENYAANLEFTEKINSKLDEKYPNLSKGILKKGGAGVNGVYNQDFSSHTILIEIGGPENTPLEVLNSTLAFGECFMEVIKTIEG